MTSFISRFGNHREVSYAFSKELMVHGIYALLNKILCDAMHPPQICFLSEPKEAVQEKLYANLLHAFLIDITSTDIRLCPEIKPVMQNYFMTGNLKAGEGIKTVVH